MHHQRVRPGHSGCHILVILSLCVASYSAAAGVSIQHGFYDYNPSKHSLDSGASGVICTAADGK